MNMLEGKVVESITTSTKFDTSITISFKDGSSITVELDSENHSCSCHSEYQYFLAVRSYDSETGETEITEVK
jgi:alpha-L-arabinofuranosidase